MRYRKVTLENLNMYSNNEDENDNVNEVDFSDVNFVGDFNVDKNDVIYKAKRASAMFIIKKPTAEVRKLTLTAVGGILSDVQLLVENAVINAKNKTEMSLLNSGINPSSIEDFGTNFDDNLNPFKGIETEYLQVKFFRENFGLIVSLLSIRQYKYNYIQCFP